MSDSKAGALERAIVALRQARARIETLERGRNASIAVVGMACRFPGADDLESMWRMLSEGRSTVREVPPDRWSLADYYDPDGATPGRTRSRHGGFIDRVFDFDAARFGISDAEATSMDPQQRLLLELASEAFERAGDATLEGSSTGVFVGISTHDYAQRSLRDEAPEQINAYTGTGNAFSTAVGRVAYTFGLRGPCMAVDTACSSSLVATHLACQSLRAGECDRALVAGVNVLLAPAMTVYFDRLGVLCEDGVVRAFDADARGYVRAEGGGAFVLRRIDDALGDGDPIVGVIRGSAVNHNGRSNGLTAPNRGAQVEVVRRALRVAGVRPEQLGYVEAFGAATPMGDSIELRALTDVVGIGAEPRLPIGSIKSNIGHAEAAAGAASLVKALLMLERRTRAASLHVRRPAAALADPGSPLRVVSELEPWPSESPRIAGVSGFGFGGTNAHVVLEEAPAPAVEHGSEPKLVVLSARSEATLERRAAALVEAIEAKTIASLAALSRGSCVGVRHHPVRLAVVGQTLAGIAARLMGSEGVARGNITDGEDVAGIEAILAKSGPANELLQRASRRTDTAEISGTDEPAVEGRSARGVTNALESLGALWIRGFVLPWDALIEPGPRASLPPHPFERRTFRIPPVIPLRSKGSNDARPSPSPALVLAELVDAPAPQRREKIERWLRITVAPLLGQAAEEFEADAGMLELGLGSLAVVELIQRIQQQLKIQVYPRELLGARTLEGLADHLTREVGRTHGVTEPKAAPPKLREAARAHVARDPNPRPLRARSSRLPTVLFVLSAPRCGSTLLRAMLAGHPRLFAPPELHLLAYEDMGEWHRSLAPRMMHLGLVQALMGTGLEQDAAVARVQRWADEATPTVEIYAWLQAAIGDRILVDKSPTYALDPITWRRAESWFDAPHYVLLSRHPYAVIESFARRRMEQLFDAPAIDPHLLAEEIWARAELSLEQVDHGVPPERCHRLAYEDLVTRPEPTTRALCEHLALPYSPAILTPYAGGRMVPDGGGVIAFVGDPGFGEHQTIDARLADRWKEARLPWHLDARTITRAHTLGYSTPTEGDPQPERPPERPTLPADFHVRVGSNPEAREALLTGATGFLGVHLLAELLTRGDRPVRCLVRAADPDAAWERVREAMERAGVWQGAWSERILAQPVDLAAERLGLAQAEWDALARRTALVVHNGAVVNMAHPYEALRAPNVVGTQWMLQLAAQAHGAPFHFVSTKGVFGIEAYSGNEIIDEDSPLRPIPGALGYQRSKSVAERMVVAARDQGVSTTVYRPGRLGGHAATGRVNPDDLLTRFLIGCVQLGSMPAVSLPFEMTPVDHVAAAIARIILAEGTAGRAYNLVHPKPMKANEVARVLADMGVDLTLVEWKRWRAALLAQPDNALAPLLSLFGEHPPRRVHETRLSQRNTRAADPSWAPPTIAEQLARNVAYMQRVGMLDPSGRAGNGARP